MEILTHFEKSNWCNCRGESIILQIREITSDVLSIKMYTIQEQHYQVSCLNKNFSIPSSQFLVFGSQTCFRTGASGVLIHK